MTFSFKPKSIGQAVLQISTLTSLLMIGCVVLIAAVILFNFVKAQKLEEIARHVEDRALSQQQLFMQVRSMNDQALKMLQSRMERTPIEQSVAEFDRLFPLQPDRTRRSVPELFDGTVDPSGNQIFGIGAFMRRDVPITDQDKHLLVNAFHIINRVGPVAAPQFDNFWFFTPKDQMIIFAPDRPDKLIYYRRDAEPDLTFAEQSFSDHANRQINPFRSMSCTNLSRVMYDQSGLTLTSGCLTPFDENGELAGAFGTSLFLKGWLDEVISPVLDYATPILATRDGDVIAHPDLLNAGSQNLERAKQISSDLALADVTRTATTRPAITTRPVNGKYVASREISGPGWVLIMAVEQRVIFAEVALIVLNLLLVCLIVCGLGAILVHSLIKKHVSVPIVELQKASTEPLSAEAVAAPALFERPDELGELARALRERDIRFSKLVNSLETVVKGRTAELMQRETKLRELNKSLRDFTFIASHDLQTPLRHCEAFVKILRDELISTGAPLSADAAEAISIVESSSKRMRLIVRALYELSNVDIKELVFETVDLNEVLQNAQDQLAAQIEEANAIVEVSNLPRVPGVTDLLTQVFQNLISNACKYANEDVPIIRIRTDSNAPDGIVRIFIEDNGRGIPPEHQERVFQPFKRLVHESEVEGAGIGLALCRKIIERHQGEIYIDPAYTGGVRFCIALQRADAELSEGDVGRHVPTSLQAELPPRRKSAAG